MVKHKCRYNQSRNLEDFRLKPQNLPQDILSEPE